MEDWWKDQSDMWWADEEELYRMFLDCLQRNSLETLKKLFKGISKEEVLDYLGRCEDKLL